MERELARQEAVGAARARSVACATAFAVAAFAMTAVAQPPEPQAQETVEVRVRTAPPPATPDVVDVPSPMEVTVPIPARMLGDCGRRCKEEGWATEALTRYRCDTARFQRVQLVRRSSRGKAAYEVKLRVASDYYAQDADISAAILVGDEVLVQRTWPEVTYGSPNFQGTPFAAGIPELRHEWRLTAEQAAAAAGASLRLTLAPDE